MRADGSSAKLYRVKTRGLILGPFSVDQLRELLEERSIGINDMVCGDGTDWVMVGVLLGPEVGVGTAEVVTGRRPPPRKLPTTPPAAGPTPPRRPSAAPPRLVNPAVPERVFGQGTADVVVTGEQSGVPGGESSAGLPSASRAPLVWIAACGVAVVLAGVFVVAVMVFRSGADRKDLAGGNDQIQAADEATEGDGDDSSKELVTDHPRPGDDVGPAGFQEMSLADPRSFLSAANIKRALSNEVPRGLAAGGPRPVWPVFLDFPGPSDRDVLRRGVVLRWPVDVDPALDFESIREMSLVGDWRGTFARHADELELSAAPSSLGSGDAVRFVVPRSGRFADRLAVVLDDDGLSDSGFAEMYAALCWQVLKITRNDGDVVYLRPWSSERPTGALRELCITGSEMQVSLSESDLGFGLPADWATGSHLVPSLYRCVEADGTPIAEFERGQSVNEFVSVEKRTSVVKARGPSPASIQIRPEWDGDLEQAVFFFRGAPNGLASPRSMAKLTASDRVALKAIADRISRKRNHGSFFDGEGFAGANAPQRKVFRRHARELLWKDALVSEDLSLEPKVAAALNFDPKFRILTNPMRRNLLTKEFSRQLLRLRGRIVDYLAKSAGSQDGKDERLIGSKNRSYIEGRLYYVLEDGVVAVLLGVVEFVRPADSTTHTSGGASRRRRSGP